MAAGPAGTSPRALPGWEEADLSRIRRVKCDETKPSCMRCEKGGRVCDGYRHQQLATSSGATASTLSTCLGAYPARSEADLRAFEYFRQTALLELIGFDVKSEFWSQTVLQFSETSPAVLRAALALSARHEHICNKSALQLTTESELRSLRQYNKSIRQLCSTQVDQPIHFTLTCCVLFICLENLSGNHDAALLHLQNGLKVLREWHSREVTFSEKQARDHITVVFCRLDMQATAFLDSRRPELDLSLLEGSEDKPQLILTRLCSLYEAQLVLEKLTIRLFYILTTNTSTNYPPWSVHNEYLPTRLNLLRGLRTSFLNWKQAFDEYCAHQSQTMKTKDLQLSVILALHHQATSLMLDLKFDLSFETKLSNDSRDSQFVKINQLARSLMNSSTATKASFSANMGVISSVYFVAMTASNVRIRREAIEILGMVKGREGFWDARTAAKIAERVLNLEETGLIGAGEVKGGIPAWIRAFEKLSLDDPAVLKA